MTSSSEEDVSGGLEGLAGGRSESVTYPRFFLVGMTSPSDSSDGVSTTRRRRFSAAEKGIASQSVSSGSLFT